MEMLQEEWWRYTKENVSVKDKSCDVFCRTIREYMENDENNDCEITCKKSNDITIILNSGEKIVVPRYMIDVVKKLVRNGNMRVGDMAPIKVLSNETYYLVVKKYFEDNDTLFFDVAREKWEFYGVSEPV